MSSSIDKKWINESDQRSTYYIDGVKKFISFVDENGGKKGVYLCPCTRCKNMKTIKLDDIHFHLLRWGFIQSYTVWYFHGEKRVEKEKQQPVSHATSTDESEPIMMEDLVNDADRFHHFQPENPLSDHANVGEPSTVNGSWQANESKKYKSLFDSAKEPLYPSCSKGLTKLYAIVKLNSLKTQYGFSNNGVTALLELIKELLPEGNTLPTKYSDVKKLIKQVGMNYKTYDACINDCILYWKDDANRVSCTNCNEPRYMTSFNEERKCIKVPRKTLRHFPLISRLKRLYSVPWIADAMTWHGRAKSDPTVMRHPCDTSQWKAADYFDQTFAVEPRNVTLGIATDGFCPHASLSNPYSCWPVIVVPYNLPPSMCMKREFSILTLLISGPKQPGKDIDVYLQPLIDELKQLWEGVVTYDSLNKSEFTMRARVLWAIHDHPALGTLSGCTTHGYFACPVCGENTCSYHLPESKKVCYMGHRMFLPKEHKFRYDKTNFNNEQEFQRPKRTLTGFEVEKKVANIKMKVGKHKEEISRKRKKSIYEEVDNVSAWYRRSIFFDLPYWKANMIRHNIDVMHTEKNVTEHLISTVMDHKDKSKDGINARKDLKIMGIKQKLWVMEDPETNKIIIPKATFTLSKEEKIRFCTILKNLKVPNKFSSNFHNNVSINPPELRNMKSHDYHVIMQHLLPVLLQHSYPQHKDLRNAIHRISLFFNILCSKVINREHLIKAKASLVEAMCVFEKHFPPAFFDISIHLMVHLADEALICGPVRYRWMYPFERLMKTYKGYVRNKRYIEGCIAEGYIVQEASLYCMEYMPNGGDGNHKHTREAFLDEDDEFAGEIPLDNGKDITLTQVQFEQVRRWVLNKYDGLDEWKKRYNSYAKSTRFQSRGRGTTVEVVQSFTLWLRNELLKCIDVDPTLWRLVHGPKFMALSYTKYQVNGFLFSTKMYENRMVTQDSGVCMKAITKFRASGKDKNYKEAETTYYGVIQQILELDYTDFKQTVFYCDWVKVEDKINGCKIDPVSNLIMVNLGKLKSKDNVNDEPFILASEASQVFYSTDLKNNGWSVVLHTPKRLTTNVDDIEFPTVYQSAFEDNEKLEDLTKTIC